MNFILTDEQIMIRNAARDFAVNECLPGVIERDSNCTHATEQIKKMGKLGFLGMMVDPALSGSGMDTISYVLAIEEISKIDNSVSVCMSVQNSLVLFGMEAYGSEAQKKKYIPPLASLSLIHI